MLIAQVVNEGLSISFQYYMVENKFVILKTYRNTRNLLDFLNIDPQGLQEKFCKAEQDWYGGPHLISDFDFIISVYMLYILCVKCKFSLSIMLCQFIIINIINNNSLNIKP